jgi:2-hydroxymuconate-semialdehyde hydrolase
VTATGAGPDPRLLPGGDHVVDGVRLYAVSHGAGPGLPVLLVHGLPTSSYLWNAVARDLGRGRKVLAPDLVGLGRSERPRDPAVYRLDRQARLLAGLLEQLKLDRVVVVGHDLGGAVALQLAALAPDAVAGVVLVDAGVHADCWPSPAAAPWLLPGLGTAALAVLRRLPAAARRVLGRTLAPGLAPAGLERYLATLLRPDGPRGLGTLLRAVDLTAAETALHRLATSGQPALLLWGEHDHLLGLAYARRLAAALPAATLVAVAGSGHLLPQERPERVAEEVAAFADSLGEQSAHPLGDQ